MLCNQEGSKGPFHHANQSNHRIGFIKRADHFHIPQRGETFTLLSMPDFINDTIHLDKIEEKET